MNAPTEKITNNYKWLQFTKIQLSRADYYTHFPHSFQQLLKRTAMPVERCYGYCGKGKN